MIDDAPGDGGQKRKVQAIMNMPVAQIVPVPGFLGLSDQLGSGDEEDGVAGADDDRQMIKWPRNKAPSKQFTIAVVHRRITTKGKPGVQTQWECVCPRHSDVADAAGTKCKKALAFSNPVERDERLRLLKHWALLGRHCEGRADPPSAHKDVDPLTLELRSHKTLNKWMAWALDQYDWLQTDIPLPSCDSGRSSSSSSTSRSATSSKT